MPAYSMDLRKRVLADCEEGLSSREAAKKYRVSRSWVDRLRQRKRETGRIGPMPASRYKPQALAEHMDRLRELVEEKPDRTLAELREELGVETSLMSVWRALQRLNLTLKKSPACI